MRIFSSNGYANYQKLFNVNIKSRRTTKYHCCGSSIPLPRVRLFSQIHQVSETLRGFFVPLPFNKVSPRVKDTPEVKERHCILCIIWSHFHEIIRNRNDMIQIHIKNLRYPLAKLTDTSVSVGIFHIFIWDAYFVNSCDNNKLPNAI